MEEQREIDKVVSWVKNEDVDALVRDHAASVLEGLETLRMKKMYRVRDEGVRLGKDLGLEGGLRGLEVKPNLDKTNSARKMIVEEIE
jgi:hypothetical protein